MFVSIFPHCEIQLPLSSLFAASERLYKGDVYGRCEKELAFLENLAFHGMQPSTLILRPTLLEKAFNATKCSPQDRLHILNIGILKALNDKATGTKSETKKDHYFVHLSFQEHFAARYLMNALKGSPHLKCA